MTTTSTDDIRVFKWSLFNYYLYPTFQTFIRIRCSRRLRNVPLLLKYTSEKTITWQDVKQFQRQPVMNLLTTENRYHVIQLNLNMISDLTENRDSLLNQTYIWNMRTMELSLFVQIQVNIRYIYIQNDVITFCKLKVLFIK